MSQHVAGAGDAGMQDPSDPGTDRAAPRGPAAMAAPADAAPGSARAQAWRFFRYTLLRGGRAQLTRLRRLFAGSARISPPPPPRARGG